MVTWRGRMRLAHPLARSLLATLMYFRPGVLGAAGDVVEVGIAAHAGELDQHRQIDAGDHFHAPRLHHRDREVRRRAAEHVGQEDHAGAVVNLVDGGDDVASSLFHVVVRADRHGLARILMTDHMFERGAKFRRQLPMSDKHETDHEEAVGVGRAAIFPKLSLFASPIVGLRR